MNINRNVSTNSINTYKQNLNKSYSIDKKTIIKKDSIEISKQAKEISLQLVNDSDDLKYEKIMNIKKSIQDGTYTINHKELAKKIIEKMRGQWWLQI